VGEVRAVAFTADGSGIVTAGADGTVRIWPDDLPRDRARLRAFVMEATDAKVGER
jgi:hypothetical protein